MIEKSIHHVCIQTNQYEDSLKFYQEALGFQMIQETPNFHQRHYNTWLGSGSFYIELQTGKVGEVLDEFNPNTSGLAHLCFWVSNLDEECERIKQLGYKFKMKDGSEIYRVENGRLCKIIAPEGTIIELRDLLGV